MSPRLAPRDGPWLEARAVRTGYPGREVVREAAFTLVGGQLLGVAGANGAGKSTLVKALAGVLPMAGTLLLDGRPLRAQPRRLAWVPQAAEVDWGFPATTAELVAMGATPCHGLGWLTRPARRALPALERVGLAQHAALPIAALSGGQRRRALVARALLRAADVLLLDEPFAGLDEASEQVLWREIERERQAGRAVLLVHHDLQALRTRADAVLWLPGDGSARHGAPAAVLPGSPAPAPAPAPLEVRWTG